MNKLQTRSVAQARAFASTGLLGAAARTISAEIRCAMTERAKRALHAIAVELGVDRHPDYII